MFESFYCIHLGISSVWAVAELGIDIDNILTYTEKAFNLNMRSNKH